jgi:hypothetical protein
VRFALELLRRAAGAELERRDDGPVAGELRELRMFGAGRRGGRILDEPRRQRSGRGNERDPDSEGTSMIPCVARSPVATTSTTYR